MANRAVLLFLLLLALVFTVPAAPAMAQAQDDSSENAEEVPLKRPSAAPT